MLVIGGGRIKMIKVHWDGRVDAANDYEQELIDQDMLAQLHANHMDNSHICIEDECPYWQPEE